MADLIDGSTAHTGYAPLSTAQTVAISRHLQDQIRQMDSKFGELQKGLQETTDAMLEMRERSNVTTHAIHSLQDGLKSTNGMVDANRKELGRAIGGVQKLQAGLDQTSTMIAALRDTHQVTNTNLQKVGQDQVEAYALAVKLQEAVERRIDPDIADLKSDLSRTNLDLKHLKAEEESDRASIVQERDLLRQTNHKVKGISDDLAETNTLMHIVEQRMTDNTTNLKVTRQSIEELKIATLKMNEDHDNTKSHVGELGGSVKKAHGHVKQVHEMLNSTNNGLNVAVGRLEDCCRVVDTLRGVGSEMQSKCSALKDAQDRANGMIQQVRRELSDVGATTMAVKAGLKEQSSLLLPNLTMDSQEARQASERHGSLLRGGATGMSSPRKPGSRGSNLGKAGLSNTAPGGLAWT